MKDHLDKSLLILLMSLLPKNIISFLTGVLAQLRFPKVLQSFFNRLFVKIFRIDLDEATKKIDEFNSLEEIFIRTLKKNSRSINGRYCSSADGVLECSKQITSNGHAIQAKGLQYSIGSLIFGETNEIKLNADWYSTVYLAPHNYHRVHAPFSGALKAVRYIPGRLWPVNKSAVRSVPGLFCVNERLVFDFELEAGGRGWVVMVGAFNVGRMMTHFVSDLVSNSFKRIISGENKISTHLYHLIQPVQIGDELGVFMLGSTTVVVLDREASQNLNPIPYDVPIAVSVGQNLAR